MLMITHTETYDIHGLTKRQLVQLTCAMELELQSLKDDEGFQEDIDTLQPVYNLLAETVARGHQ